MPMVIWLPAAVRLPVPSPADRARISVEGNIQSHASTGCNGLVAGVIHITTTRQTVPEQRTNGLLLKLAQHPNCARTLCVPHPSPTEYSGLSVEREVEAGHSTWRERLIARVIDIWPRRLDGGQRKSDTGQLMDFWHIVRVKSSNCGLVGLELVG